jgi:hypothetical protein
MRTINKLFFCTLMIAACDKGKSDDSKQDAKKKSDTAAKADADKPATADKPAEAIKPTVAEPPSDPEIVTGALTISEGKSGIEEDGFLHIYGEMKNETTDKWIAARVAVDLLDASGKPLGVDSIQAGVAADLGEAAQEHVVVEREVIPPGESSPFHYLREVTKIGGSYAKHTLSPVGREVSDVGRGEIRGVTSTFELGSFAVKGTLVSTGEHPCEDPSPILALYDAQGKLVALASNAPMAADGSFVEKLDKDQSLSFELSVSGEQTQQLKTFVKCEEPD